MGKRHTLALLVGAMLAVSVPSVHAEIEPFAYCPFQTSSYSCGPRPLVTIRMDGLPKPAALPRSGMAPIAVEMRGTVASADGSHPPALRKVVVILDKNSRIDANGLPSCGFRDLEQRSRRAVRAACREAIVGGGTARIGLATAPEQPLRVPLTLVNGGVKEGTTKLFIHAEVPAPEPVAIVSVAKVEKTQKGRYGHEATWQIPRILDGDGSLLEFALELERGYVSARCTDGKLQASIIGALFRDEAGAGAQTTLKGTVIRPCTQAATTSSARAGMAHDEFCSLRAWLLCGNRLILDVIGTVRPKALPEDVTAPVSVRVRGSIGAEEGDQPPALREVVFGLDRDIEIDAASFPICADLRPNRGFRGRVDLRATCPNSIVGRGTATMRVFPGQPPQRVSLSFFNGGVFEGAALLGLQIGIASPHNFTGVELERARKGPYGYTATWEIIPALGEALAKFDFRLKRGYVRARCADDRRLTNIAEAHFRNEGEGPRMSTTLKRTVVNPCTPRP